MARSTFFYVLFLFRSLLRFTEGAFFSSLLYQFFCPCCAKSISFVQAVITYSQRIKGIVSVEFVVCFSCGKTSRQAHPDSSAHDGERTPVVEEEQ